MRGRRRINAEGFRWLEPPYTREEQRLLWKPPHSELADALAKSKSEHPDALFAMNNGLNLTHRKAIIEFASQNRLPSMHAFTEATRDGALISYATNRPELFQHAAEYVGKILKGANPADMPIEQPTKFELAINLRTARALGLTIPRW